MLFISINWRFVKALSFFCVFYPYDLPSGPSDPTFAREGRSPEFLYGGKSAQQLSYGFNILELLEGCPNENQIFYGDIDFSKKVSKVTDFR